MPSNFLAFLSQEIASKSAERLSLDNRRFGDPILRLQEAENDRAVREEMRADAAKRLELSDAARVAAVMRSKEKEGRERVSYGAALREEPFDPNTMDPDAYDMALRAAGREKDRDLRGARDAAAAASRDRGMDLREKSLLALIEDRTARDEDRDAARAALGQYRASRLADADADRGRLAAKDADLNAYREKLLGFRSSGARMKKVRDALNAVEKEIDDMVNVKGPDALKDPNYTRLRQARAKYRAMLDAEVDSMDSEAPPPPAGGTTAPAPTGGAGTPDGGARYGWILPRGTPGHPSGTDLFYTSTPEPPVPGATPWPPRDQAASVKTKDESGVPVTGGTYVPWDEMRGAYLVDPQSMSDGQLAATAKEAKAKGNTKGFDLLFAERNRRLAGRK